MAIHSEFIGPDGQAISERHNIDICECSECEAARWQKIEREQRDFSNYRTQVTAALKVYEIKHFYADAPDKNRTEYYSYQDIPVDMRRRFATILRDPDFYHMAWTVGRTSVEITVQ